MRDLLKILKNNSQSTQRMEFTTTHIKPNREELLITNTIATEYLNKIKTERDITDKDINCLVYSTGVTVRQHLNNVNKRTVRSDNKQSEPKWMTQLMGKINSIRKNLSHIKLIQKCKQNNTHQTKKDPSLTKQYKTSSLMYHAKLLKHELKVTPT